MTPPDVAVESDVFDMPIPDVIQNQPPLKAWQRGIWDVIRNRGRKPMFHSLRKTFSAKGFNDEFGVYVNMGRREGHTYLATRLLLFYGANAVLIVPNDTMKTTIVKSEPFFDLDRNLQDRIVVAKSARKIQDALARMQDTPMLCIVDVARYTPKPVLELLRGLSWRAYVELG